MCLAWKGVPYIHTLPSVRHHLKTHGFSWNFDLTIPSYFFSIKIFTTPILLSKKSNTLQKASLRNHVCSRFNHVNNMHDAHDWDIRVLWHLAWRPRTPSWKSDCPWRPAWGSTRFVICRYMGGGYLPKSMFVIHMMHFWNNFSVQHRKSF